MKFKVKDMDIASGGTLVVVLNERDAALLDLKHADRVLVKKGRRSTTAIVDIAESRRAVPPGSIGFFEEMLDRLRVRQGTVVDLALTSKPESVQHIRDKLYGKELEYRDMYHIIDDIVHDRLTAIEKTYFVAAGFTNGWTIKETVDMTHAIVRTGQRLAFKNQQIFDKHCIGGVPNNRTTMIVVPIVAAAGLVIPKSSSRAITSPAGTADTMEVLANVDLPISRLKQVVKRAGAAIVWGGAINLAPADDKIIDIEHPLSIDAEGQLLASVMAKKASVGATHVLIDIPVGWRTKAKTKQEAVHLQDMFRIIGSKLGIRTKVILTEGNQPIGKGVGPVLEARDVMWILENDPRGPADLKEKSLMMAGMLLEMSGKFVNGRKKAEEVLASGAALQKMRQIIEAQGVQKKKYGLGKYEFTIYAKRGGVVDRIDNDAIAKIARVAGAPTDKGSGLYLYKKLGDHVKKGEALFAVYAESKTKLGYSQKMYDEFDGVRIV